MNVIKRDGREVLFDKNRIINAIFAANNEVDNLHKLNIYQIRAIADNIENELLNATHAVNIEDIQNMVEKGIMSMRGYEVAQKIQKRN